MEHRTGKGIFLSIILLGVLKESTFLIMESTYYYCRLV